MRDKLKDKDYYKSFLNYQYERIEKKTAKLKESDGDKRQRVLLSLTGYEIDLLKAEFSSGASREDLKTLLIRAMGLVSENNKLTYDDLLTLLSLAVILDAKSDVGRLIEANKNAVGTDRLLNCIATFIKNGTVNWDKNISLKEEYDTLDQVFNANDKEEALKDYLTRWYEAHSGYAWYNAHLRDTNTYCGYWSFESAAIVKMLSLSEDKICDIEYYPAV